MKVIAATLCHNTPDLADAMRLQIPDVVIVDNGSLPPIPGATVRLPINRGFVGGWNDYMQSVDADYVWMLNSDLTGVSEAKMYQLAEVARYNSLFAVSPAFNSPHSIFWQGEHNDSTPRITRWLDWCCPMVDVKWWRELGGFDERSSGYFADVDLSYRARLAGCWVAVCDRLTVHHIGSVTASRIGHTWSADDTWLRVKYGVNSWMDLV